MIIFMIIKSNFIIEYYVHKSMVKDSTKSYHKGNFDEFKKEFNKRDWEYKHEFEDSLFEVKGNPLLQHSKIHASIIEFNKEGLILNNLIDFYRFTRFRKDIKNKKIILNCEDRFAYIREEEINKLL